MVRMDAIAVSTLKVYLEGRMKDVNRRLAVGETCCLKKEKEAIYRLYWDLVGELTLEEANSFLKMEEDGRDGDGEGC